MTENVLLAPTLEGVFRLAKAMYPSDKPVRLRVEGTCEQEDIRQFVDGLRSKKKDPGGCFRGKR